MSRIPIPLRVCAAAWVLLGASSAFAQQQGVLLDVSASRMTTSGTTFVPVENGTLTTSARYDTEYRADLPGLRYYGSRYRFEVSFSQMTFLGSAQMPVEGRARASTTPTLTSLDVQHFSFGFRGDVIDRPLYSLGLGVDLDRLQLETDIISPDSSTGTRKQTYGLPVATIGASLHDPTRRAFFDLKLGYGSLGGTSKVAKARTEAGYSFVEHAGVKAAWEGIRYERAGFGGAKDVDLRLSTFSGGFYFRF